MAAGEKPQPFAQLGDTVTRQQPLVRPGIRYDEEGRLRQPQPLQAGDEISTHLGQDPRRHPVEDHTDGGLAACGLLQGHPGRLVAVTRRSGHEEPQVGGLEQPARELPIGLVHRVKVRGVDKRQPRWDCRGHLLTADLRQRVLAERLHVLGVGHQDRSPGGGAQHPGVRDLLAEHGVDERRLSGTRRASNHHDGRDVGVLETRNHLIAHLSNETVAKRSSSLDSVGTESQIEALEVPDQVSEDFEELNTTQRGDGGIVLGVARGDRSGHVPTL